MYVMAFKWSYLRISSTDSKRPINLTKLKPLIVVTLHVIHSSVCKNLNYSMLHWSSFMFQGADGIQGPTGPKGNTGKKGEEVGWRQLQSYLCYLPLIFEITLKSDK